MYFTYVLLMPALH